MVALFSFLIGIMLSVIFILLTIGGNTTLIVIFHLVAIGFFLVVLKLFSGNFSVNRTLLILGLAIPIVHYLVYYDSHKNSPYKQVERTLSTLEKLSKKLEENKAFFGCSYATALESGIHVEVVTDPFNGEPLVFLEKNGKCIIYSVGLDRVDNSGMPFDLGNSVYHANSSLWLVLTVPKILFSEKTLKRKLTGDIVIDVQNKRGPIIQ